MSSFSKLNHIFHPESVAIVGASEEVGSMGAMFLKPFLTQGFKGSVYLVHRNKTEVMGIKCYPALRDIPGDVDYVIVAISASNTPELMRECVEKKVKACTFFTAGFSESGTKEGIALENEILEIARANGIRIVGPNSMGIYSPATGLYLSSGLSSRSGSLGIICQSGGNAIYLSRVSEMRGAAVSKAVSYGNACDISESDLLEYFAEDNETKVIIAYIEGVKDGKRFYSALKKAAGVKPVIILKGGKTDIGAKTAASHTGALSGSLNAWTAMIKQAGAIQADTLDELIDLAVAFTYIPPLRQRRVSIMGVGGGVSVLSADSLLNANLSLPPLPEEVKKKLQQKTNNPGYIYTNPIDTLDLFKGMDEVRNTVEALSEWEEIDILIPHMAYDIMGIDPAIWIDSGLTKSIINVMVDCIKKTDKPMAIVLHYVALAKTYQAFSEELRICCEAGIAVFLSMDAAGKALDKFIEYYENIG